MKIIPGFRRRHYLAGVGIFLVTAALIVGMAGCVVNDNGYTPSQNLEIQNWYDLDAVRNNLNGNHILLNDLDSTTPGYAELASPTANGGTGWQPIGTQDNPFTGTFDGQGYEIRDLYINRPDEYFVGLFGYIYDAGIIKDIGVLNVTVTGCGSVGGLAGGNLGTVSNSYSSGSVNGNLYVGGLVGVNYLTVSNSYSTGSVDGFSWVGGLVGWNSGTIDNCCSTGSVTAGSNTVGGLAGENDLDGIVTNSYSTSNVAGSGDSTGGLVGWNRGTLNSSYATGNVTGEADVGGLVGYNLGNVSNSYSTGNVTGVTYTGGLVGENDEGTVSNSFWDTQTSGQATSAGGTGKNTTEMQDITTFSGATWNITTVSGIGERNITYIWNIVNNVTYPFLSWQP